MDDDGQIESHELSEYLGRLGGHDFDSEREIRDAVAGVTKAMDSTDVGSTISEEELLSHLTKNTNQLLTAHRVERWVRYGLGFPQYAQRFEDNAITALDFTALIANDGAALREDLGVVSGLHHGKLMRALKRQILGLGSLPSDPMDVTARAINATAIAVQWKAPEDLGTPPVHAYVIQERVGDDNPQWETVGHVTTDDQVSFVSRVKPKISLLSSSSSGGVGAGYTVPYRYRVIAWGAHGCSGYSVESAAVEMKPVKNAAGSTGGGSAAKKNRIIQDEDEEDVEDEEDSGGLYSLIASTFLVAGLVARFIFSSASFIGGPGTARSILWKGLTLAFNTWRGGGGKSIGKGGVSEGDAGSGGGVGSDGGYGNGYLYGGEKAREGERGWVDATVATATVGREGAGSASDGGDSPVRRSPSPPTIGAGRNVTSGLRRSGSRDNMMSSSGVGVGGGDGGGEAGGGGGTGAGAGGGGGGGGRPPLHRATSKSWIINDAMAAAVAAGVAGGTSPADGSPARERMMSRGTSFASLASGGSGSSLDDVHGLDRLSGGGATLGSGGSGSGDYAAANGNGGGGGGVGAGVRAAAAGVGVGAADFGGVCGVVVGSEAKKKGRCCAIGCEARWDRWTSMGDIRMKYTKHYCGLCQRAYCQAHTRISPHGAKGRCDPESKCYCATCYATLDAATQEALEVSNKLPAPKPTGDVTPRKKAKTLWRSIKNYKLRTASSANLAAITPSNSSGNLAAAAAARQ